MSATTNSWAWPLYPFGSNTAYNCHDAIALKPVDPHVNICLSSDVQLTSTARLEPGRPFGVLVYKANSNQVRFGVGRRYYLPTAEDVSRVQRLFPDLSNPMNPNWLAVKVELKRRGHEPAELAKLTPPELLTLLDTTKTSPAEKREAPAPSTGTQQAEGEKPKPAADPFADLRAFACAQLKGQERAVIEALCDAAGELPIADLGAMNGVGWDDEFEGFKNAQKRLNPKLKRIGWTLSRQNNAAKLNRNRG